MSLIEFYPQIKWLHVATVVASGALFALRGGALLSGAQWAMLAPVRHLSYAIDTVLLTAAVTLAAILHQYPFVHGWLTVKIVALAAYIVLGSFALKRARTRATRIVCFVAALVLYLFIVTVARAHHPLGVFARLFS